MSEMRQRVVLLGYGEGGLWGCVEVPGEGKFVVADVVATEAEAPVAPDADLRSLVIHEAVDDDKITWVRCHRESQPHQDRRYRARQTREPASFALPHQGRVAAIAAHLTKVSCTADSMAHFASLCLRQTPWLRRHSHHTHDQLSDGQI